MTSRTHRHLAGTGFALFAALAMTTAIGSQALAGSDSHAAAKDALHAPAHKSADGELAVVGIMLQAGEVNIALREIWGHMARKAGPAKSVDQVEQLAKAAGHNSRPVQDVNNRLVLAPNGSSHSSH